MKLLGQMKNMRARPFDDDDYGMDPQGMVAVGGYVITSIVTARESDYPTNIRNRLVVRSFPPSLSAKETGRVEVWQTYLDTTDTDLPAESLPYPSNGYDLAALIKLDETRFLAVFHHGIGTWSDTNARSTAMSTAFVVTVGTDGRLTRGPYTAIEDAVLGGVGYYTNFYEGPPILALTAPDTVTYAVKTMAPRDAAATSDALASLELKVSGTTVTVGAWTKWVETVRGDGVGRPYPQGVFGLGGSPYIVAQNAPLASGYGAMLYGATPGGPGWELGADWSGYLRTNVIGGDAYLLGVPLNANGAIVAKFDGTTLTRLRTSMTLPPVADDKFVGGNGWAPPEPGLVGPDGKMLIWTWGGNSGHWRVGAVSAAGYGFESVDLGPSLPAAWLTDGDDMTLTVAGRYAVVEVHTTDAGDGTGLMDAAYFLVELVAPPRMGPKVTGAHFS